MKLDSLVGKIRIKRILSYLAICVTFLLLLCGMLLAFTANWLIKTYGLLTIDEIVYHLKTSVAGTSLEMILGYILGYAIWAILITVLACILFLIISKRKPKYSIVSGIALALIGVGSMVYAYRVVDAALGLTEYLNQELFTDPKNRKDYVAEMYVDASKVDIKFPGGGKGVTSFIFTWNPWKTPSLTKQTGEHLIKTIFPSLPSWHKKMKTFPVAIQC